MELYCVSAMFAALAIMPWLPSGSCYCTEGKKKRGMGAIPTRYQKLWYNDGEI